MNEREQLEQAIAMQETMWGTMPDAVIDTTIKALQAQLAALEPVAAVAPEKQRKQITVLFADVSGFPAMSETLDAEDVGNMMNALWQEVDAVILNHGGRIDKHIGDAVMALWGAEQAREDDPEQAVRAALAMQTAVAEFAAEKKVDLKLRIGLNTGPVLLGEVGTMGEFTAMGDTVNTASRLEQAAPVGGILISHDTYHQVRGVFDFQKQKPLNVKGKTEPLHVYLVKQARERAFRPSTRGIEGVGTRMVGRDAELATLQHVWQTAVAGHKTQLVTISGEAGVGKSRLLHEFEKWLEEQPATPHIWRGRSAEQTATSVHFLLRDTLRHPFQIQESDANATVHQKVEMGVARYLTDEAEKKAHFLGHWIGYDFSHSPYIEAMGKNQQQLQGRGLLYWGEYAAAVAATTPLVILWEDIHWGDDASLDALVSLLRRWTNLPLLVVCLTRPSLFVTKPEWPELPEPDMTQRIALTPLPSEVDRELLAEILRYATVIPDALFELVVRRAEGNPFYMEELVKMLLDKGVILPDATQWHIDMTRLNEVKIPATLTGVLQARLDRLESAEKQTLQRASVVGRVFWDTVVSQLGSSSETVKLASLQQRELIFQRNQTAFAGTDEFLFKHDLLRDVTYETVLKQDRKRYHEQVAQWLIHIAAANKRADEYSAMIAAHFDRAEAWEKAQQWYRRAGELAARQFNNRDAVYYLTRCLELTPDTDDGTQFQLLLLRENVYSRLGMRREQGDDLQELERLALLRQQSGELAEFAWRISGYDLGDLEGLVTWGTKGVNWAQEAEDKGKEGRGELRISWGKLWLGEYEASLAHLQQAEVLFREANEPFWQGFSLVGYFYYCSAAPESSTADSLPYLEQGLAIAQELNNPELTLQILRPLSMVHADLGNYVEAEMYMQQSLSYAREVGFRMAEANTLGHLSNQLLNRGDYEGARKTAEEAVSIQSAIGRSASSNYSKLGAICRDLNQYDQAHRFYEQAFEAATSPGNRAWSLTNLGYTKYCLGDYGGARTLLNQALLIRRDLQSVAQIAHIQTCLAMIDVAEGKRVQAKANIDEVLSFLLNENALRDSAQKWQFRMRLDCYHVLVALAHPQALTILESTCQDLQMRANKMPEEMRRIFLNNVPAHREIVALWQKQNESG